MSARRRRLSAGARVALAVTLVLGAGVAALSGLAYATARSRLSADLDRTLVREAEAYAAAVGPASTEDTRGLLEASRAYLGARSDPGGPHPILLVRFVEGHVLSNSDLRLEAAVGNVAVRDPAAASRGLSEVTLSDVVYRVVTSPVSRADGTRLAVFQAALPVSPTSATAAQLGWSLLFAGLIVTVIGAALSALVARATLAPLHGVAQTARAVTQQRLTERVDYDGPDDEIGSVVSSLNAMLDRLEEGFGDQRRFIADASHELRTPLTILRGNLDIIGLPETTEAERDEAIEAIDRETDRMGRIVGDLLALAGLESGQHRPMQEVATSALVAETVARMRALGTHDVRARCSEGELWVRGDPDRLQQVLVNLVGNAMAHTPEGGAVAVACHSGALSDGRPAVLVEVEDSGGGIRDEDLPRIFDRFYRAQGRRSGTGGGSGLGLAIAKRLVELHSGEVSAANRAEGGARFTVALPRIDAPAE